jgi:aminoglycoside phosphotransferase family enzyme/predicted kinase
VSDLVTDLKATSVELRETHISWVFLHKHTVFKVKKPVSFGFLDFTDLESRRAACEAEVTLNARLAPNVYLGVVPVTRDELGAHQIRGRGAVVDWAVQMRRLPDAVRADVRLEANQLEWRELESLAVCLARFHAAAPGGEHIDPYGRVESVAKNVRENFAQAHGALQHLVSEAQQQEIEKWQLSFLTQHEPLFNQRIQSGKIRDGHGDLRLEHVYFEEHALPTVIDCIEFNERFRFGDVCADVAFLSMDLAWHGRSDLKERFLAAYARESNDYDLYGVVDFYESYRAYVRAKVSALGYSSAALAFEVRRRLEAEARRYFLLALASERPPLEDRRVIAVGGLIATGKSTLAEALAAELAVVVISSDRTRKFLKGVALEQELHAAPWEGAYTEELTEQVYTELFRQASVVLASGRSVVIDASFRTRKLRDQARALAARAGVPFVLVECRAPEALLRARLSERASGPSISDGRLEILGDFSARYEAVGELEPKQHVVVDTSAGLELSLEVLRRSGIAPDARV